MISVYLYNKQGNDMKTYEGETLIELQGQLNYVNDCLLQEMENWERKEYIGVKTELEYKINLINNG